jgi:hypothetical protein
MDQDARRIEGRDDGKRDDPRAADGKGHRKAGHDPGKKRQKDDDQPDFYAVQTENH